MKRLNMMFAMAFILISQLSFAQPGPPDVAAMVSAEKTKVVEGITNLSVDQQVVMDQIYTDFESELETAFSNSAGNREAMHSKMISIRNGKDEAMKELLTPEQFITYETIISELQKERRAQGSTRGKGGQSRNN